MVCLDEDCVSTACNLGVFAFLYKAETKARVAEVNFVGFVQSAHLSCLDNAGQIWRLTTPVRKAAGVYIL